jgi:hypothetical protein
MSKPMNGNKVSLRTRNMQNIFKGKIMMRCEKCRLTNMSNPHTSSICSMNLVLASVLLPHDKLVQFTSNLICSPHVRGPGRVNIVARDLSSVHRLLLTSEVLVKALPATKYSVANLFVQLAYWFSPGRGPIFATTTSKTVAEATTTTTAAATIVATTTCSRVHR